MNLQHCKDGDLLFQIKNFVREERRALMQVLAHLREIERRRLYSDLGYKSLFDYVVKELAYSEDQAARRIQAMRLIKDIPEAKQKIASGELSLSNAHQVQTLFKKLEQDQPERAVTKTEKLEVIAAVENKSRRDAEIELIKWRPRAALPKERERVVTEDISEVRFLLSDQLKAKLETVRSLLGPRGIDMSYAELFEEMSDLTLTALTAKHFGKRRTSVESVEQESPPRPVQASQNVRYISKGVKHEVWKRDQGRCCKCGGQRHLNYDHILPVALGGLSNVENLRLLCFGCNQRASSKVFGVRYEVGGISSVPK